MLLDPDRERTVDALLTIFDNTEFSFYVSAIGLT